MLGVFLDIEKAFDMVWRKCVLYKMDQLGFYGRMFNWVQHFLCGCTIQVRRSSVLSDLVEVQNGIPQGSVISPIMFLLAINDLRPKGIKVSMFVDDTAIWDTRKDVVPLNARIQARRFGCYG